MAFDQYSDFIPESVEGVNRFFANSPTSNLRNSLENERIMLVGAAAGLVPEATAALASLRTLNETGFDRPTLAARTADLRRQVDAGLRSSLADVGAAVAALRAAVDEALALTAPTDDQAGLVALFRQELATALDGATSLGDSGELQAKQVLGDMLTDALIRQDSLEAHVIAKSRWVETVIRSKGWAPIDRDRLLAEGYERASETITSDDQRFALALNRELTRGSIADLYGACSALVRDALVEFDRAHNPNSNGPNSILSNFVN